MMELKDIKGFGAKRIEALNEHGIFSPLDLLKLEPNKYLDYSAMVGADKGNVSIQTIKVQVQTIAKCAFFKGKSSVTVKVADMISGAVFTAVWYNQPFMKNNLKTEDCLFLTGKFNRLGQFVVSNMMNSGKVNSEIVPVYGASAGLSSQIIRNAIGQILDANENWSVIDCETEARHGLISLSHAFRELHFPTGIDSLEHAKARINMEDMLLLRALEYQIQRNVVQKTRRYEVRYLDEFKSICPYILTHDQDKALREICDDLCQEKVMNRLLLGDVGSGKTAVALGASYVAARSGYQTVLLCPTEILSQQHFESAQKLFKGAKLRVGLLNSKLKQAEKKFMLDNIRSGEVDLLIATHSALGEKVEFENLGLVITDEQHRFGVAERAKIEQKGENPDVLVMSATPIPRSLSLVLFGGLAVSEIKSRPAGESQIKTNLVSSQKERDMWKYIVEQINGAEGKCFVVVPRIEDGSNACSLQSVGEVAKKLLDFGVPEGWIASVHGKTDRDDAARIISEFKRGDKKVLICTTIVEVGIDVPTANLMVIYNGERFGLATLHQLRGRIGRDGRSGYCFVMAETANECAVQRLEIFKRHNSGVRLAEEDLKLRGAGTMYGTKQHGASEIFVNLDFSIEQFELAGEIFKSLKDENKSLLVPLAEARFGNIYKKVVLN